MDFLEPFAEPFLYAAWSVQPRLIGPLVAPSARRRCVADRLATAARSLVAEGGARHVRLLRTGSIPPLPGRPHVDLALVVRGGSATPLVLERELDAAGAPRPALLTTARNVTRFGDTEATSGTVLLNHFEGSVPPARAEQAWRRIADWYASALGVHNSTLLRFPAGGRFVVMNYAVIPGDVARFMAGQLLRPSFHREVRPLLRDAGIRALPVFLHDVAL